MKGFIDLMPKGEVVKYKLERFPMKVEGDKVSFGEYGYLGGAKRILDKTFFPSLGTLPIQEVVNLQSSTTTY